MATKSQSPGPNPTTALPAKQARSRKPTNQNPSPQASAGRAGSAGGIVLEKAVKGKTSGTSTSKATTSQDAAPDPASTPNKPRRKPRKLNKDPTPTTTQHVADPSTSTIVGVDTGANAELEALKSRVRGLEAKVEQLYSGTDARTARSPRRRGKGRKESSSTQVPTISTTANNAEKLQEVGDEGKEADEELVRLEGELEVARQDLEAYRPRTRRTISQETDDVEEIPRDGAGLEDTVNTGNKHVTLSGSYRIPLPTNVSIDDVKNIQSGVSAAQNVARSFLEQRRAAAALRGQQNLPPQPASTPSRSAKGPKPKAMSSSMEVAVATDGEGEKQSWSEWIGGYSMAITRAVKSIEHEAAMESQKAGAVGGSAAKRPAQASRSTSAPTSKKNVGGKRPAAKAKLSSEQVHGLMS